MSSQVLSEPLFQPGMMLTGVTMKNIMGDISLCYSPKRTHSTHQNTIHNNENFTKHWLGASHGAVFLID